jgi:hypothetical protein
MSLLWRPVSLADLAIQSLSLFERRRWGAFYRRSLHAACAVNSGVLAEHGKCWCYFKDQVTGRLAARSGFVCLNLFWFV